MVIAQDAQGVEVARPWVEKAGGTFRALLDQRNQVGKAYNLKFVPVAILVDGDGRLVRPVGSVNIDDDTFYQELKSWAESGLIPATWREGESAEIRPMTGGEQEADARFQLAIVLLDQGKREPAIAELKEAFKLDPRNWLIRKQLWAVETPEAFYVGDVDYAWQKEQMSREEALLEAGGP